MAWAPLHACIPLLCIKQHYTLLLTPIFTSVVVSSLKGVESSDTVMQRERLTFQPSSLCILRSYGLLLLADPQNLHGRQSVSHGGAVSLQTAVSRHHGICH